MQNLSRRSIIGSLVLAAGLGTALTPAIADEVIITRGPPPLRTEVIPVLPRERVELEVWQPGHWRWNGREHVGVEGHYAPRPRREAVWIPAHYDRRPGGWVFIEGHWN
jgi:hypothetical protein